MSKNFSSKILFFISSILMSSLSLSIFTIFNDTLKSSFHSGLIGIFLIGLLLIEILLIDELEKTDDFGVNLIAANILIVFPILSSIFILFCIILKIIFFKTL